MFWLFACAQMPETVTMSGTVLDAPGGTGDPVAGATVSVTYPGDEAFASATTADDGTFSVDVPAGQVFYVQASADGLVPTAFSGQAGLEDFSAGEGVPWLAQSTLLDEVRTLFAGCEGVDAEGVMVIGQVKLYAGSTDPDAMPAVPDAAVTVVASDGEAYPACYLDDEAVAAPDATATGVTGDFAVFGLPAGEMIVEVEWTDANDYPTLTMYGFVAPEGGLVPVLPAMVESTSG